MAQGGRALYEEPVGLCAMHQNPSSAHNSLEVFVLQSAQVYLVNTEPPLHFVIGSDRPILPNIDPIIRPLHE